MLTRKSLFILYVCSFLFCVSASFAGPVPDTGDPNEPACNPHSYTDLGTGVIKDNVTGFMWQKDTATDNYTWQQSVDYCNNLSLGGYSDWRLPTVTELSTLVDSSIANPGPTISTTYFPDTAQFNYWSSTPYAINSAYAWFINFGYGYDSYGAKTVIGHVRAVRGNQETNNFVDNGDNTITDTSTGLMWQKATAPGTYTLAQAKAYCDALTLGGSSDWRLPTRNELQSIVDYTTYNPSISSIFSPNQGPSNYWSSTTFAFNSTYAWIPSFYDGNFSYGPNLVKYSVRAVRAGQCGSIVTSTTTTVPGGTTTTTTPGGTTTTTTVSGPCPAKKALGENNPKLENLRDFRDSKLVNSAVGRKIIQIYYTNADSINAALERSPALMAVARRVLEVIAPMVGKN